MSKNKLARMSDSPHPVPKSQLKRSFRKAVIAAMINDPDRRKDLEEKYGFLSRPVRRRLYQEMRLKNAKPKEIQPDIRQLRIRRKRKDDTQEAQ